MKVVTNVAIPVDVYEFFLRVAEMQPDMTPEEAISVALTAYYLMLSEHNPPPSSVFGLS